MSFRQSVSNFKADVLLSSTTPRSFKATIKRAAKKHATCFATLLQHELNTTSDIEHFTTHVRIRIAKIRSKVFCGW